MKDKAVVRNVAQTFYDSIAAQYDKFYLDWDEAVREEALFLDQIFEERGFDKSAGILDCACGIGTQAIGLAALGYDVAASDISEGEIEEAKKKAFEKGVDISFRQADFRALEEAYSGSFDIIIAMDNALPHMLSAESLQKAIGSITGRLNDGGMFVASIRDYDLMLEERPAFSAPYVHKTEDGQRVLFQTWDWEGDNYKFTQYIIEDGRSLDTSKFECEYRATRRDEITKLLYDCGCSEVSWLMPGETGFYQPVVVAVK